MGIYGTWEKNEDGSYTLTDEDDEDNVFTLTWNEDGTASYSLGDGETKDLTTSIGPVAFNVFKAENVQVATTSGIGVNVPYAATVQAMGSDLVIDAQLAGTASIAQ